MKFKIVIECEDEEELEIIKSAKTNYFILQGLYDEVFRPVIKYSESGELIELYEDVWARVNRYIEESE